MSDEISITDATDEDIMGIRAVQKHTWLATYPNKEYGITTEDINARFALSKEDEQKKIEERKKILAEDTSQHTWVAKDEDRVIGFCATTKGEENHIQAIYVLSEFQGKGVGTRLIQKSLEWLGDTKDVYVHTAVYNKPAIAFYERMGFVDTGEKVQPSVVFRSGAVIPEIKMIKKLNRGE